MAAEVHNEEGSTTIEDNEEETDLTNLTWLTELRNQNITFVNTLHISAEEDDKPCDSKIPSIQRTFNNLKSKSTKPNKATDTLNKNIKHQTPTSAKRATPAERYKVFLDKIKRDLSEYNQFATNYQTDAAEKPPFNYSHIIGMAMLENGRVTLQQICAWIEEKFAFFRMRKKWNNSIRHNLSLHYCFRKIDRNKFEKGKGGYWELGVDPKKCERKRIRNRRTSRNKINVITDRVSINSNQMPTIPTTSENEDNLAISALENLTNGNTLQEDFPLESSNLPTTDILLETTTENASECQQFHLGTIIINTNEANMTSTNLNLIDNSYDWQFHPQIAGSREYVTAEAAESFIEPSCINSKEVLETSPLKIHQNTVHNQHMMFKQFNIMPGSSFLRQNVIVEQVLKPNECINDATENTATLSVTPVAENSTLYVNAVNDNFRPYIDGIEEAFQYLRSIDQNNREDILDNILDISVSDY